MRYPMPKYSTMTDAEVWAIYAYLQSVPKLPATGR
ncbi:MAG: c-type cytochrome [Janthinobacterium lividum]